MSVVVELLLCCMQFNKESKQFPSTNINDQISILMNTNIRSKTSAVKFHIMFITSRNVLVHSSVKMVSWCPSYIHDFIWKTWREESLERPRKRWEDNIKMYLKYLGCIWTEFKSLRSGQLLWIPQWNFTFHKRHRFHLLLPPPWEKTCIFSFIATLQ